MCILWVWANVAPEKPYHFLLSTSRICGVLNTGFRFEKGHMILGRKSFVWLLRISTQQIPLSNFQIWESGCTWCWSLPSLWLSKALGCLDRAWAEGQEADRLPHFFQSTGSYSSPYLLDWLSGDLCDRWRAGLIKIILLKRLGHHLFSVVHELMIRGPEGAISLL